MIKQVTIDGAAAIKALGQHARQFPFAVSKAINGMLYEGQAATRRELSQHFTVRRRTFLEQSIKVKPSDKRTLTGEVGVYPRPNSSIHEALAVQEHGGQRAKAGAIPIQARPTPQAITPPSKWPGKLKRTFAIPVAGGQLILQRIGTKRSKRQAIHGPVQRGHDPQLRVMYKIEDSVEIPKRWNFVERVLAIHRAQFPKRFAQELANALRTAK